MAKFLLNFEKNTIDINEHVRVDAVIDSGKESVNAISGTLHYDPEMFRVESVATGNSAVNFWITAPAGNASGIIEFSGIIPGGITTEQGQLFSVVFSGVKSGPAVVAIKEAKAYLNDGEGTSLPVTSSPASLTVTTTVAEAEAYLVHDSTPPEKFSITRTRDQNIFDGKWFVVFATQDKESGVASYQVCESRFKKCVTAESPHLLSSQSNFYAIKVKAQDGNGNVQTVMILSPGFYAIACIIVAFIGILVSYGVFLKRKKRA